MNKLLSLASIAVAMCCLTAAPALAVTTFTVTNVGSDAQNLQVHVTITEIAASLSTPGSVDVKLEVADGYFADLRGAFMHIQNESLINALVITGDDVESVAKGNDSVIKVTASDNLNGQVKNIYGKFDFGVEFGTPGIGTDDIRTTTFNISHATLDITEDMFTGLAFGVRATSVGVLANARGDSSKLAGLIPPPDDDDNNPGGDPDPDPTPTPEPATAALGMLSLAGVALASRRRRNK